MGSCVTPGTPSIALGTSTPCQWIVVGSGSSFLTTIRIWSPSVTRIIGPGTVPLYVYAVTVTLSRIGHCTAFVVNSKTLTPFSSRYSSGCPPWVSVAGWTFGAVIGSIMCAASGFSIVILPGVGVSFTTSELSLFTGTLFGPRAGAQAERIIAKPTTENTKTFFIKL